MELKNKIPELTLINTAQMGRHETVSDTNCGTTRHKMSDFNKEETLTIWWQVGWGWSVISVKSQCINIPN